MSHEKNIGVPGAETDASFTSPRSRPSTCRMRMRVERSAIRSGPLRPGREGMAAAGGAAAFSRPSRLRSSSVNAAAAQPPARKRCPDQASCTARTAAIAGARNPAPRASRRTYRVGKTERPWSIASRQQRAASTMTASAVQGSGKADAVTQDKVISSHKSPCSLLPINP